MIKLSFKININETKYEALVVGLSIAKVLGPQVVVNQVLGKYTTKDKKLKKYLQLVWDNHNQFDYFNIEQIPREKNCSKHASTSNFKNGKIYLAIGSGKQSFSNSCHQAKIA